MWIVVAVKSHDDFEEAARTLTSIKDGCCRFVLCLDRLKCKSLCAWRQMTCQQSLTCGSINVPCPLILFNSFWPSCKQGWRFWIVLVQFQRKCTCPLLVGLLPSRLWPSVDRRCSSTNWFIVVKQVLGGSNYKLQSLAEANTVQALVSMLWLNFLVWNNHAIDQHPELDEM